MMPTKLFRPCRSCKKYNIEIVRNYRPTHFHGFKSSFDYRHFIIYFVSIYISKLYRQVIISDAFNAKIMFKITHVIWLLGFIKQKNAASSCMVLYSVKHVFFQCSLLWPYGGTGTASPYCVQTLDVVVAEGSLNATDSRLGKPGRFSEGMYRLYYITLHWVI